MANRRAISVRLGSVAVNNTFLPFVEIVALDVVLVLSTRFGQKPSVWIERIGIRKYRRIPRSAIGIADSQHLHSISFVAQG
jgi:hypothetical protein